MLLLWLFQKDVRWVWKVSTAIYFRTLDVGLSQLTQAYGCGLPGIRVVLLSSAPWPCVPLPILVVTVIARLVGLFSRNSFIFKYLFYLKLPLF